MGYIINDRIRRCVICNKLIDTENDTFVLVKNKITCERCFDRLNRCCNTEYDGKKVGFDD